MRNFNKDNPWTAAQIAMIVTSSIYKFWVATRQTLLFLIPAVFMCSIVSWRFFHFSVVSQQTRGILFTTFAHCYQKRSNWGWHSLLRKYSTLAVIVSIVVSKRICQGGVRLLNVRLTAALSHGFNIYANLHASDIPFTYTSRQISFRNVR